MKKLIAIAACCASVALAHVIARGAAASGGDGNVAEGKKLTVDTCANDHCHGGSAPSFDDMKGVTEARVRKVIAEGLPDSGMPPFRGVFTPEQVDDIAAYIVSVANGSGAPQPLASHAIAEPTRGSAAGPAHRSAPATGAGRR